MMIIEKSHLEINKKYKNNILNFNYTTQVYNLHPSNT